VGAGGEVERGWTMEAESGLGRGIRGCGWQDDFPVEGRIGQAESDSGSQTSHGVRSLCGGTR
jgi:hypothetical protein